MVPEVCFNMRKKKRAVTGNSIATCQYNNLSQNITENKRENHLAETASVMSYNENDPFCSHARSHEDQQMMELNSVGPENRN